LWNSNGTDSRGSDLEALILHHKLNIVNKPCADLDFVPGGTSFIDVTLAGDRVNILRWSYLAMPSLSDHPYIYFEVVISGITPLLKSPAANKAPSLFHINQRSYLNCLALTLNKWEPHSFSLSSPDSIDRQIERLSSTMVNCARRAKVKKSSSLSL
jgi:hypothetical protein